MNVTRVVLDTNVLVAAIRSRRGASFRVLSLVGTGAFTTIVSVPLVLEYEEALLRHRSATGLSQRDIRGLLDYVCRVGEPQDIFYLWRPLLRDPKDDLVLEAAVAGGCSFIVTHNRRDFLEASSFGLKVIAPAEFLKEIER